MNRPFRLMEGSHSRRAFAHADRAIAAAKQSNQWRARKGYPTYRVVNVETGATVYPEPVEPNRD